MDEDGGPTTPLERRSRGYVDYDSVAAVYQSGRALTSDVLERWGRAVRPYLGDGPIRVVDLGAGTGIFATPGGNGMPPGSLLWSRPRS